MRGVGRWWRGLQLLKGDRGRGRARTGEQLAGGDWVREGGLLSLGFKARKKYIKKKVGLRGSLMGTNAGECAMGYWEGLKATV